MVTLEETPIKTGKTKGVGYVANRKGKKWYCRINVMINGKPDRRLQWFATEAEAITRASSLPDARQELAPQEKPLKPIKPILDPLFMLERFAQEKKAKANTIQMYRIIVTAFVDCCDRKKLTDYDKADIDAFEKSLKTVGLRKPQTTKDGNPPQHTPRPLKDISIFAYKRHLHAFFKWCAKTAKREKGMDLGDPFLDHEWERKRFDLAAKRTATYLEPDEIEKLLETAKEHGETKKRVGSGTYGNDIYLFCTLCVWAGMRPDEAVNARWEWFNWKEGYIHIRESANFEIKTHLARQVPLLENLREILEPIKQKTGYIIKPDFRHESNGRKKDRRWSYKRPFETIIKKAQMETVMRDDEPINVNPKILRHTFATLLLKEGVVITAVRDYLGHTDVETTQRYAHGGSAKNLGLRIGNPQNN